MGCDADTVWQMLWCALSRFGWAGIGWGAFFALLSANVVGLFRAARFAFTLLEALRHVRTGLESIVAVVESWESGHTMALDAHRRDIERLERRLASQQETVQQLLDQVRAAVRRAR